MAEGAAYVLLDIIGLLVQSTVGTMLDLLGLSGKLLGSLSFLSSGGGLVGIGVAMLIISVVGFLVAKFLLGSVKTLMKLAFAAVLLATALTFLLAPALTILRGEKAEPGQEHFRSSPIPDLLIELSPHNSSSPGPRQSPRTSSPTPRVRS